MKKFKDYLNEEIKYTIKDIQNAMIDSKEFTKSEIMTGILKSLKDVTNKKLNSNTRFSWDEINKSLTNMNVSPKKIATLLIYLKKIK